MRWSIVLLLGVFSAVVTPAQVLKNSPFHGDTNSIGVGKSSFRMRCSSCHGIHAGGGRGPALNHGDFEAGDTDLDIYRVIAQGVPGTEMPAYGPRYTEENIWRIVAFLRTFEPAENEKVDGDLARGKEIFWNQAGCGSCHSVGKRGSKFGPSLDRIGRSRSVQHLRDSLLDPDKDLLPGYYVVRVVTHEGHTILGIGSGYDDFSAQLIDASGKFHSYFREEVQLIEREYTSLMPSDYGESLPEDQQRDLLAYMQSLRGEERQ